ncbi:MAG: hypothetical protein ACKVWR_09860 [Acidimicrobiales bacterium]
MAHTWHVLTDLDDEWLTVRRSAHARQRLADWQALHGCLAGAGDLDGLIERIRCSDADTSTAVVWALLDLAVDDRLARRVLLQTIVPGLGGELEWLLCWARRVDATLLDLGDVDQLLIASAVEAILHAAGKHKPWPVLSMLRRTHRLLLRATRVEAQWRSKTVLGEPPRNIDCAEVESTPAERLTTVLGEARGQGAVSQDDAALVWLTRVGGYRPAELETRFAATGDCLRRRRHRAEARLAVWAEAV